MKVLLIYPNVTHQEALSPGIGYISGWLKKKKKNYDIRLFDFTWGSTVIKCLKFIKDFKPDVIGFSISSFDFHFTKYLISEIREFSNALIVLGGVHPIVDPEQSIKHADVICIGEGEQAFEELLEKIESHEDYSKIQSLWVKKGNKIFKNELRDLTQDLDIFELDRDIFDIKKYVIGRNYLLDVYAGRGCPYNCTYCINYYKRNLCEGKGKFIRMRTPENVIEEIKKLKIKYGIRNIDFQDDTFTHNRKWLLKFCDLYSKEVRLPFVCNARVETITEETAKALKKANCNGLLLGVESGSERIRKKVLGRQTSNEQIIKAFNLAHKYGIKTLSFNMVGIPFETIDDIKKTIQLNRIIRPTDIQTTILQPFPGTQLYELAKEKGWLTNKKIEDWIYDSVMNYKHISAKKIKKVRDRFAFDVFVKINLLKAIRTLLQGVFYNKYMDNRSKIPLFLRKFIQRVANTFVYS